MPDKTIRCRTHDAANPSLGLGPRIAHKGRSLG